MTIPDLSIAAFCSTLHGTTLTRRPSSRTS